MAKKQKKTDFLKQKQAFSTLQLIVFGVIFTALGAAGVWQTSAAPPSKGGTGTISAPIVVEDRNVPGQINWNDRIRFNITTTATTEPFVNLKCYVNGVLVAEGYEGYFERAIDDGNFGLASNGWTGGAADCTATVVKYQAKGKSNWVPIVSTSFHVNP